MKKMLKPKDYMNDYEKSLILKYNKNLELISDLTEKNELLYKELELLDSFNEDLGFWITRFDPEVSGLPAELWIYERNLHEIPIIRVIDPNNSNNAIVFDISDNPKIIAGEFIKEIDKSKIINFIEKHKDDLLRVYFGDENFSAYDFICKYRIDKPGGKD